MVVPMVLMVLGPMDLGLMDLDLMDLDLMDLGLMVDLMALLHLHTEDIHE